MSAHPGIVKVLKGGLAATLLLVLAGCGSRATVTGKVLVGDEPVTGGTVTFLTDDDHAFSSPIKEDGAYTIEKIPPGPVKIGVLGSSGGGIPLPPGVPKGGDPFKGVRDKLPGEDGGGDPFNLKAKGKTGPPVPTRYSDARKSGLTYTVTAGTQDHNITLEADSKKHKQ
jgi:hypothetical protein